MAIRINKVYTRGGDQGETSLVGGARVPKDSRKLESYGTVDELLCFVGQARMAVGAKAGGLKAPDRIRLDAELQRVQNKLFDVGSILATPAGHVYAGMPALADADSVDLEKAMDSMQAGLPALDSFVLPGGSTVNAALHICRAVCRRAEREILRLSREEAVDARLIKYMNRLSDYFFVMSRFAAKRAGAAEFLWEYPNRGSKTRQGNVRVTQVEKAGKAKQPGKKKKPDGKKVGRAKPV